ncbi:MAG: META domain-containing protein [Candidatus Binatia bacterium]
MMPRMTTVALAVSLGAASLSCAAPPPHPAAPTPTGRVREPAVATPRDDLAQLAGRNWVLREWRAGETFVGTPVVTFSYAEGRVNGRSGCNRYNAAARTGQAGTLTMGPVAGTRMACSAAVMAVESRFLAALGRVERWALVPSGHLELGYKSEQGAATLTFSEVTARRSK